MSVADRPLSPPDGKVPAGPLARAVIAAAGGLVGAFFAQVFLCSPGKYMLHGPTPADLVLDCGIACAGVVVGALFLSWVSER
jgi:hypothetical protein